MVRDGQNVKTKNSYKVALMLFDLQSLDTALFMISFIDTTIIMVNNYGPTLPRARQYGPTEAANLLERLFKIKTFHTESTLASRPEDFLPKILINFIR